MTKVVEHIVLLTLSGDAREMVEKVKSLAKIPGVTNVSTGSKLGNFSTNSHGFDHVICVTLESKEALHIYQEHEHHVHVRDKYIKPVIAGPPIAVDWESELGSVATDGKVNHLTLSKFGHDFEANGGHIFVEEWMSDRTGGYKSACKLNVDSSVLDKIYEKEKEIEGEILQIDWLQS